MSTAPLHPSRLSRQGLLLIKSFAGFRPQAVRRRDGVLIIGYGHSQTARLGVVISEAEAELLLLHDLIPVIEAIHAYVKVPLNPHQFDALASFILSIGIERFTRSDVLELLNKNKLDLAASAMNGWPDRIPPPVDAPYRRRSAERALFENNPFQSADLAKLLTAPIPLPETGIKDPLTAHAPATIPVVRHEAIKSKALESPDYGALVFTGAIGALAVAAGLLSFRRELPPSQPGDGALIIGVGLMIAGSVFIAAAAWSLFQNRNKRLLI